MKSSSKILTITVLLLFSISAWAASTKQEVQELSAQVEEMRKDLAEIKKLIKEIKVAPVAAKRPEVPFKEQVVSIGNSPFLGKADAPLTLIEYSDYQCPYCARHYRDVLPNLKKDYIDTGILKYVMRELPLISIHPNAMKASQAALCAGDQEKYFEMHDMLFDNQREMSAENLKAFAGTIGLDTSAFNECFDSKKYQKQIGSDMASSKTFGLTGTPAFLIGVTDEDDPDKVLLTKLLKGARAYGFFKTDLDSLLKTTK